MTNGGITHGALPPKLERKLRYGGYRAKPAQAFDRQLMLFGCQGGATVLQENTGVIPVMGLANARLHDGVGRHPAHDETANCVGPEYRFQRRTVERTDAVFNDVEVTLPRAQIRMNIRSPGPDWAARSSCL